MIHPDTELRFVNSEIGFGVFATRPIPKGTITWVQDDLDQVLSADKLRTLGPIYAPVLLKYSYMSGRGDYILCWDLARFINHSCAASCLSAGYNFEIAVRDINAGEELTDDYATLNLSCSFLCFCGAPACRGVVREDDVFTLADEWDRTVREAFPSIARVAQPLWELVAEKEEVQAALAGGEIASCRQNLREFSQVRKCAAPGD